MRYSPSFVRRGRDQSPATAASEASVVTSRGLATPDADSRRLGSRSASRRPGRCCARQPHAPQTRKADLLRAGGRACGAPTPLPSLIPARRFCRIASARVLRMQASAISAPLRSVHAEQAGHHHSGPLSFPVPRVSPDPQDRQPRQPPSCGPRARCRGCCRLGDDTRFAQDRYPGSPSWMCLDPAIGHSPLQAHSSCSPFCSWWRGCACKASLPHALDSRLPGLTRTDVRFYAGSFQSPRSQPTRAAARPRQRAQLQLTPRP